MFKWSRVARMNGATENGFMRPTRVPYKVLYALLFTTVVVLIALLLPSDFRRRPVGDPNLLIIEEEFALYSYNRTYPLSPPTREQRLWGYWRMGHSSRHDDDPGAGDKNLVPDPHPHVLLVSSNQLQWAIPLNRRTPPSEEC